MKREGKKDHEVTGYEILDCISDCAYNIDNAVQELKDVVEGVTKADKKKKKEEEEKKKKEEEEEKEEAR